MLPEHDKPVKRMLGDSVPKDVKDFIEYAESIAVKAGENVRFTKGELAMGVALFNCLKKLRKQLGDETEPVSKHQVGSKN